ncbi:hypothetical protein SDC9_185038 [bioreactor metagenome]|uniref:Uncharacterized protein n=2 Tax=root TaxID=1 RepID=A0A323V349_9RHOO|nr:hypothetical protein DNK49_02775 [Azoarcus communis] [Parazoarcus communis SWub3 = DSM 12120]
MVSAAELEVRAQAKAGRLVDGEVDAARLYLAGDAGVDEVTSWRAEVLDAMRTSWDRTHHG